MSPCKDAGSVWGCPGGGIRGGGVVGGGKRGERVFSPKELYNL